MMRRLLCAVLSIGLMIGFSACAGKKKVVTEPEITEPSTTQEPNIRSGEYTAVSELSTVYFDYNRANIRSDAQASLKQNAAYLKNNKGLEILIEGYCDERGTIEYNMALGQRRAAAARDYLAKLGISSGRISTISYGKENPADPRSTEEAWAKNRRAEFKVRAAAK
jgi:peptidoglycan-associated lipoprotein